MDSIKWLSYGGKIMEKVIKERPRFVKGFAKGEIVDKISQLASGKTYIDVDARKYQWDVYESIEPGKYYLMAFSDYKNRVFVEEYDLSKNTVQYFGGFDYEADVNKEELDKFNKNSFVDLSGEEKCELARLKLDNSLKESIEEIKVAFEGLKESDYLNLSKYRVRALIC